MHAIVAPHAGLMFSGPVGAFAYKAARLGRYDAAVLVGPSHFIGFEGAAVYPEGAFATPLGPAQISFEVMDAGEAGGHAELDVIVSSMTLHWLPDPPASLERLRRFLAPSGILLYATIGPESFAEWRATLAKEGLPSGLVDLPALPGTVEDEKLMPDADALAFLRRMKAVGGLTPREGYAPLSAGALRRAICAADAGGRRITWHIVYGRLGASEASRSNPSTIPA